MPEPTVCVKALRAPFFTAAVRTGQPIPVLKSSFALSPTLLTDLTARVPHRTVVRVWDALAEACADPTFGLSAAALLGVPQLDLVDHVLQRSPTMRALSSTFVRYQRLFHEANDSSLGEVDGAFVAEHRFEGALPSSRHFEEFILAMWMTRLRMLVGGGVASAERVFFRHRAPRDTSAYVAIFGREPEFEANSNALVLPVELLDRPLASHDPAALRAFEAHLEEELARLPAASFPDGVRAQVVGLMRAGSTDAFDIEAVARRAALSRRTLQRRLSEHGTSFRSVIDAARREVALEELSRGAATVTDLAFLLGFSEHSAFSRAFRRWTGKSPAGYLKSAG
ncbi:MAG: AraC family transcriptional regulator [Polyangiaceae bacterium]